MINSFNFTNNSSEKVIVIFAYCPDERSWDYYDLQSQFSCFGNTDTDGIKHSIGGSPSCYLSGDKEIITLQNSGTYNPSNTIVLMSADFSKSIVINLNQVGPAPVYVEAAGKYYCEYSYSNNPYAKCPFDWGVSEGSFIVNFADFPAV